jgi:hypothetical protein
MQIHDLYTRFEYWIWGFDPGKALSWSFRHRINVSRDLPVTDFDFSEVDAYEWKPAKESQKVTQSTDPSNVQRTLNIAKATYCRFNGWIGTEKDCLQALKAFETIHGIKHRMTTKSQGVHAHARLGFWKWEDRRSKVVAPTSWSQAIGIHSSLAVSMRSTRMEDVYSVFATLQDAVRCGHEPEAAWALVCAAADAVEVYLDEERGKFLFLPILLYPISSIANFQIILMQDLTQTQSRRSSCRVRAAIKCTSAQDACITDPAISSWSTNNLTTKSVRAAPSHLPKILP